MSGIAGLLNLGGRPADADLLGRMLDPIVYRGTDRSRTWVEGPAGLAHCLLATTPESVGETQPCVTGDGLAIVFDGRLDNRGEIAHALGAHDAPPAEAADAVFVLAAYRRWERDCAVRLLGDFAFVIWDATRQRMFCARDVMGQKPFYYHHGPDVFLFGSDTLALLAHPAVTRRPNEGMAGEYLSVITSTTDTLFADVQRLPRGHSLTVSADGVRLDRYWSVENVRSIRYRRVEEYSEHLLALLADVVDVRLRASTPVGVMLSGGIDSSSILATAVSLRDAGRTAAACDAYSIVDPGGVLDEKPFIDRTAAALACVSHQFLPSAFPAAEYRESTRRRADVAASPDARLMAGLQDGARERGVRVLLSGVGSDEWLGGSFYHCADLFRTLRWIRLGSYVREVASHREIERPRPAVKVMTWPLLPRRARRWIKQLIRRDGVPRWIRPEFAARIGLADRLYPDVAEPRFPTIAQRSIYLDVTSGLGVHGIENDERLAAERGIEVRRPFSDRRMMEFGLGIPEELRWRGGMRKRVLREAMRGRIPDAVVDRTVSPNAGSTYMPTLRAFAGEGVFRAPAIEREGWLDGGEARAFYDRILARQAAGDPDYTDDVWPMWSVAGLELWMQHAAEPSAAV